MHWIHSRKSLDYSCLHPTSTSYQKSKIKYKDKDSWKDSLVSALSRRNPTNRNSKYHSNKIPPPKRYQYGCRMIHECNRVERIESGAASPVVFEGWAGMRARSSDQTGRSQEPCRRLPPLYEPHCRE